MKTVKKLAAGVVLLTMAVPASAIVVQRGSDLYDGKSLVDPTFTGSSRFSGVGFLQLSGPTPGAGQIGLSSNCTGSLISSSIVLTAAHCFGSGAFVSATLRLPDAVGAFVAGQDPVDFAVHSYLLGPSGSDLMLMKLAQPVENAEIYSLYDGDPLGRIMTRVGTGSIGTGETGDTDPGGVKRYGYNTYDGYLSDIANSQVDSRPARSILIYDFDDGTDAHDALGRLGLHRDPNGVVIDGELRDAMAARGTRAVRSSSTARSRGFPASAFRSATM